MNLVMDPVRVARPTLILNVHMSFSHGSELVVGSSSAVSSVTGSGTSMDPPQFQGLQFFSQVLAPGRILLSFLQTWYLFWPRVCQWMVSQSKDRVVCQTP